MINENGSYSGGNCPKISPNRISNKSGTKAFNPPMKPHPAYPIILSLALLLSACVPIPATAPEPTPPVSNPTPASAAETKAGFSDLASALAKADESDDIQQYSQLLDEFNACMQADVNNEEDIPEFSDSETVAVSIYFAGMLSMAQFFMLEFEDAFTENTAAGDETEDEPSAYEMLEMGLTACQENESE